jgi:DNA-binding XRE family transcriptional regulator
VTDETDEPTLEQVSSLNRTYFRAMGRRITELRHRHQMTQAELARLLGVTQQTVYAIECAERRVRIDWLPVLTATFCITADELLGLKPLPQPPETHIGPRLQRHIDTLRGLSDADQGFIMKLADSMAGR